MENTVWSRNPIIIQKLSLLWNKDMLARDIATCLNKEFKLSITGSSVRTKIRMFGLKQRSVRGPNKKKKVAEQVSKSEKPVFSKPSMPIIPKSKFFDTPVGKDADHFITY